MASHPKVPGASDPLPLVCAEGEGQKIEFKLKASGLAKEMVSFANASGGSIWLGIADDGQVPGIEDSNRLRSEIQATANTCDPRIPIRIVPHGKVLEIDVPEGEDKPYRCRDGFFLRVGPNAQQLTRDEILKFVTRGGRVRFDEMFVEGSALSGEIDAEAIDAFRRSRKLSPETSAADILQNIGLAQRQKGRVVVTRAALLFFGQDPQRRFPEAFVTCACYGDATRPQVLDRLDVGGHLLRQFEGAAAFLKRNLRSGYRIEKMGPREEVPEIPEAALREALLNALTHRDYFADSEHVYVHVHPGRVEITNPGGLPPGMTLEDLGTRAVPRNRLIADLFHRMGYVERLGSGIARMRQAMAKASLPPPRFSVSADAFRVSLETWTGLGLDPKASRVLDVLRKERRVTSAMVCRELKVSSDSAQRLLAALVSGGWIDRLGSGRATHYVLKGSKL